ncbi:unnamed protein product [Cercospora beticola]|nr:unnamed protein product [Cercospora beticola]
MGKLVLVGKTSSVASSVAQAPVASSNPLTTAIPSNTQPAANPWQFVPAKRSGKTELGLRKTVLNGNLSKLGTNLASQMQNMSLSQHPVVAATHYDPSMGPTPYQPEGSIYGGSAAPTENSLGGYNQNIQTNTCVRTNRSVRSFKIGEVIALPFHVPNLNPNNNITHDRLRVTCEGPVFSKRRMFVILWINQFDMFCLPLYSFEGQGITKKKGDLQKDYIEVKNVGVKFFEQMGLYRPVEMQTYDPNRPMTDSTTIHLTGGIKVDPQEHISTVGRFTESSHRDLLTLYTDLSKEAQKKPWNPSLGGMWR